MNTRPIVSVIMSVYNGEKYLNEAINSVLCQTFADFEFIIIDDASQDGTASIIASYKDQRILYVKNGANQGLPKSLNRGISLARGRYIARQDADDISALTRFASQVQYLDEHPEIALVSSRINFIDGDGRVLRSSMPDNDQFQDPLKVKGCLADYNCIPHSSVMCRRDIIAEFLYDEHLGKFEDYDLWLRLAGAGHALVRVPDILLNYRTHVDGLTSSQQGSVAAMFKLSMSAKWHFLFKSAHGCQEFDIFFWKVVVFLMRDAFVFILFSLVPFMSFFVFRARDILIKRGQ